MNTRRKTDNVAGIGSMRSNKADARKRRIYDHESVQMDEVADEAILYYATTVVAGHCLRH